MKIIMENWKNFLAERDRAIDSGKKAMNIRLTFTEPDGNPSVFLVPYFNRKDELFFKKLDTEGVSKYLAEAQKKVYIFNNSTLIMKEKALGKHTARRIITLIQKKISSYKKLMLTDSVLRLVKDKGINYSEDDMDNPSTIAKDLDIIVLEAEYIMGG